MQKRIYCKKHGIKLVLIPYYDESRVNYDYIMRAAGYWLNYLTKNEIFDILY